MKFGQKLVPITVHGYVQVNAHNRGVLIAAAVPAIAAAVPADNSVDLLTVILRNPWRLSRQKKCQFETTAPL